MNYGDPYQRPQFMIQMPIRMTQGPSNLPGQPQPQIWQQQPYGMMPSASPMPGYKTRMQQMAPGSDTQMTFHQMPTDGQAQQQQQILHQKSSNIDGQSKMPLIANLEQRTTHFQPPALPRDVFEGLEHLSVEMLCMLGRELVNELAVRVSNLFTIAVHNTAPNKPGQQQQKIKMDVETVLQYIQLVLSTLTEVRLRIDKKRVDELPGGKALMDSGMTDDELIDIFADQSPIEVPEEKAELCKKFNENRAKLICLTSQLKKLDWIAANSDPRLLRMSESSPEKR